MDFADIYLSDWLLPAKKFLDALTKIQRIVCFVPFFRILLIGAVQ